MQRALIRQTSHSQAAVRAPWKASGIRSFQSQYGPQYKSGLHLFHFAKNDLMWYGRMGAGMGIAAVTFALYFFGQVPRVREDIWQKVPYFGQFFIHEIPADENPF
ncbi:hypothetical protein K470DRAFT_172505 [Piedraia hortae CBS 480.64]|uniref:Uncharacterized protein n=1 Tax=Piedraia hortae CBS 480.64 TaxID=1314780 RepID=A0A6A7BRW5_9PEZI|nr:hypothetical protein K470DRAFT_172505 [Piedraia hortae CBS 480.64]